MSNPTVSVILPVYNGENYLRFAIESVLNQTFQDFELVVVDDGSQDSTPEIVGSYDRGRIRYVRQENTGVAGAFNHGLRLAVGRYVSWLSHDDVFLPTKLEKQVATLSRVNEPAVCYTDIQMINSGGEVIAEQRLPEYSRGKVLRKILTNDTICAASYSVMYDRRCVEEVGFYSESWPYTQDAHMLSKLARRFALIRVPETLMQVREHESRGIRSEKWKQEVARFFRVQLNSIPLDELFPEVGADATRSEKASACLWLADIMASHPFPLYKAAYSQYYRAIRENPAIAFALLPTISKLLWRHFRQHINRQELKTKLASLASRGAGRSKH